LTSLLVVYIVENRFSLFAVLASPLIISGSIIHMTPRDLATYTNPKAISISQDPLGYQGIRLAGGPLVNGQGNPIGASNVWGRRLVNDSVALVFVNTGGKVADIACDAACWGKLLGPAPVPSAGSLEIYDVWAGVSLPAVAISGAGPSWVAKNVSGDGCTLIIALFSSSPLQAAIKTDSEDGHDALWSVSQRSGGGGNCIDPMDCSLHGACVSSACVCRAGWIGPRCQFLNLEPIDLSRPQGYGRSPNVTAWGGSIIRVDKAKNISSAPSVDKSKNISSAPSSGAMYHLFATEEVYGCGMASWKSNSQVIHAVPAPHKTCLSQYDQLPLILIIIHALL
jgi:hypothetical protein